MTPEPLPEPTPVAPLTPVVIPPFEAAALDPYAERITMAIATIGGVLMLPVLFWYISGMLFYGIAVPGIVISSAIGVAMAVWLALNYAVQPSQYRIEPRHLVIKRRWARSMRIPLREIIGVVPAGTLAQVPRRGLRQAFNAGVFGYQGPFELEPYGRVFFCATHRERLVTLARRDRMPLIVSPARPRDFIEALRMAISQLPSDATEQV
ncbi:MAG: PH domain-containing protein [Roseiflexaceae bacterium]